MYISQFWCGVIATIGVELLGIIVYAIKQEMNKKK